MKSAICIPVAIALVLLPLQVHAADLPEEARNRIDYLIGTWDVQEELFDYEGEVVKTAHSIHITEFFLGDSVLVTTVIPDDGAIQKTIRFAGGRGLDGRELFIPGLPTYGSGDRHTENFDGFSPTLPSAEEEVNCLHAARPGGVLDAPFRARHVDAMMRKKPRCRIQAK